MGKIDFRGKEIPCTIQKENILEEEIFIENKKIVFQVYLWEFHIQLFL